MCEAVMGILAWAGEWITFKKVFLSLLIFIVSIPLFILFAFLIGVLYIHLTGEGVEDSGKEDPYEEFKKSGEKWKSWEDKGSPVAIVFLILFFASAGTLFKYFTYDGAVETTLLMKWFIHYLICGGVLLLGLAVVIILGTFLFMFLSVGADITRLIYRRLKSNVGGVRP